MTHKLISHTIGSNRFFVYKINEISCRKRLFCILNRNFPFELKLVYKEMNESSKIGPVFLGGNIGFHLRDEIKFEKEYFFRFETLQECNYNIDEIEKKKKIIDDMISRSMFPSKPD